MIDQYSNLTVKISIVMPIYNVAQYIERAVNSLLSQTYPYIEAIFIDDCGKDNSMTIARNIVKKSLWPFAYPPLWLKHNTNKGLSAARNTGIRAASGDYIFLFDSDDEITPDCIETLVKCAANHPEATIVQGNLTIQDHYCEYLNFADKDIPEFTNDKQEIFNLIMAYDEETGFHSFPVTSWNKLYKRTLFTTHNTWFKEGIIHEDEHWNRLYWHYIGSIAFTKKETYKYYERCDSIVNTEDFLLKSFLSWAVICQEYLPTLDKENSQQWKRHYYGIVTKWQEICRYSTPDASKAFCKTLYTIMTLPNTPLKYRRKSAKKILKLLLLHK